VPIGLLAPRALYLIISYYILLYVIWLSIFWIRVNLINVVPEMSVMGTALDIYIRYVRYY